MEQQKLIYDLNASNGREYLDLAVASIMLSSGKRADDVYEMMSHEYKMLPCNRDTPRRHRWVQLTSKQDPAGKGPEADRTTVVSCICLEILDDEQRAAFIDKLMLDPFCPCAVGCPFQHIANYVKMIPDCFGVERQVEIKALKDSGSEMKLNPLHFARALTSKGNRTFTKNNLGKL